MKFSNFIQSVCKDNQSKIYNVENKNIYIFLKVLLEFFFNIKKVD